MTAGRGLAGRLAAAFIHSKLTPLVIVASLLLGVYAVLALPREEEPQIVVPMIDVFVDLPGASPTEIEQRVTRPLETAAVGSARRRVPLLHVERRTGDGRRPLPGRPGRGSRARARSRQAGLKRRGAAARRRAARAGALDRRRARDGAHAVGRRVRRRAPARDGRSAAGGAERGAGHLRGDHHWRPPASGQRGSRPCRTGGARTRPAPRPAGARTRQRPERRLSHRRRQQATCSSRPAAGRSRLRGCGTSSSGRLAAPCGSATSRAWPTRRASRSTTSRTTRRTARRFPAVTLSIAKRAGTNAIALTRAIEHKVETSRGYLLPRDVHVSITRNYGETAAEKSNELLWHMFLAVVSVSVLIWLVARTPRVARRAHRHPRDAGAHAVRVLSLRLHAEPHHALRADLLHRHPGRRCDRRRREHRAAHAAGRRQPEPRQ